MKFAVRAVLALVLLGGIYLLGLGILVGLGLALYQGMTHGLGGFLLGKGAGLLLVLALGMASVVWSVRRSRDTEPAGLELTPVDQPALWEEVRSLAAVVGTRAPDAVLLRPEVNASVGERSRLLGLVGGRRVMTLGAPLVLGLTRQQLRSVLAHELGHYSHRHTALSPVVYRGHLTLARLVARFHGTLTGRAFDAYGRLYLRVTGAVTRQQEVEADAWSHRVAGRGPAAAAMRELPALDALWGFFLDEHAFRVPGARPDDLFGGFRLLLASPVRQRELDALRSEVPVQEQSPYDTHPPLRSRVDFFESLPDDGVADDGQPATALLADPDGVLRRLEAVMFEGSGLEPRPWTWLSETAGARRARAKAAVLVRAAAEPGSGAATLEDAVVALGRQQQRSLVRPLVEPDLDPDQRDAVARDLVAAVVAAALLEHCGARFTTDWDTGEALVDADGRTVDVPGLVADLRDRESASRLLRVLEEEGVPRSFRVDPAEVDAAEEREREPVVHSVAACSSWWRTRVLVVADPGLIIKRLGWRESFVALARHGTSDPATTAMRFVASLPLSALLEDPRSATYAWDRIGSVRLRRNRLALSADVGKRRLRVKRRAVAGDLVGSMGHHLGERLTTA